MLMAAWIAVVTSGTVVTAASEKEEKHTANRAHLGKTGEITLAWNPVPGAAWYNLYYSTSPGVSRERSRKIGRIRSTTHTVSGLRLGTRYYFVVTAADKGIESPLSGEVSGKPKQSGRKRERE